MEHGNTIPFRYIEKSRLELDKLSAHDIELLNEYNISIMVLETNGAGELAYVAFNNEACRITNKTMADVIGKTAIDIYPEQQGKMANKWHHETMSSGVQATYVLSLSIHGERRNIQTILSPVFGTQRCFRRIIGISREVTEATAIHVCSDQPYRRWLQESIPVTDSGTNTIHQSTSTLIDDRWSDPGGIISTGTTVTRH